MVNIAGKKLFTTMVLGFFLLGILPTVLGEFFPGPEGINMENQANITNVTRIYVDEYCFNNGTCLSIANLDVVQIQRDSMWGVALILSIIGTAFLFVYIASQIGNADDAEDRPMISMFYTAMKFLFIGGALILPIVAIQSNQGIWEVDDLDTSRLDVYHLQAWRVTLWIPIIFVSLFMIFAAVEFVRQHIRRKSE